MTRKHFAAIAAELRRQRPDHLGLQAQATWAEIVKGMADTLAQFNSDFKRDRFLTAAGLDA